MKKILISTFVFIVCVLMLAGTVGATGAAIVGAKHSSDTFGCAQILQYIVGRLYTYDTSSSRGSNFEYRASSFSRGDRAHKVSFA